MRNQVPGSRTKHPLVGVRELDALFRDTPREDHRRRSRNRGEEESHAVPVPSSLEVLPRCSWVSFQWQFEAPPQLVRGGSGVSECTKFLRLQPVEAPGSPATDWRTRSEVARQQPPFFEPVERGVNGPRSDVALHTL